MSEMKWELTDGVEPWRIGWPETNSSDEYVITRRSKLDLRLQGRLTYTGVVDRVVCWRERADAGRLQTIVVREPERTLPDALVRSEELIRKWGLQKSGSTHLAIAELQRWGKAAGGSDADTDSFLAVRRDDFPKIDLEVRPSGRGEAMDIFITFFDIQRAPLDEGVLQCFQAVRKGDSEAVQNAIDAGVSPLARNSAGDTLLHVAAANKDVGVVQLLLRRGAVVDANGEHGQTPLFDAVMSAHWRIGGVLIAHGATINARQSSGGTILHYVSEYPTKAGTAVHAVNWLLDNGADIQVTDDFGNSALHKAIRVGNRDVADLLLSRGASAEVINHRQETPLDLEKPRLNLR